jgi:hypothetical protein
LALTGGCEGDHVSLSMVGENETMFPIVGFYVRPILEIIGSQIETKRIFSLVGILINLKRGL